MRNPKRTSATAAALMIGVGLVGLITIFAASARTSVDAAIDRSMKADYVVNSSGSVPAASRSRSRTSCGTPRMSRWSRVCTSARRSQGVGRLPVRRRPAGDQFALRPAADQGEISDLGPDRARGPPVDRRRQRPPARRRGRGGVRRDRHADVHRRGDLRADRCSPTGSPASRRTRRTSPTSSTRQIYIKTEGRRDTGEHRGVEEVDEPYPSGRSCRTARRVQGDAGRPDRPRS